MGFGAPLIIKEGGEGEGGTHVVRLGGAPSVDRVALAPDLTHICAQTHKHAHAHKHTLLSSGINSHRPHSGAVLNSVVFLFEHFVDDTLV